MIVTSLLCYNHDAYLLHDRLRKERVHSGYGHAGCGHVLSWTKCMVLLTTCGCGSLIYASDEPSMRLWDLWTVSLGFL